MESRDSNGALLADGDPDEIEANVDEVRGLVLRTEFVKKA